MLCLPFFIYHKIEELNVPGEMIKLNNTMFVDNKHVNAIIKHSNKTEKFCVAGNLFKYIFLKI